MADLAEGLDRRRRLIRERSKDAAVSLFDWVTDTRTRALDEVEAMWRHALEEDAERPLSLYVHVPLCRSRCRYCMYPSAVYRDPAQGREYLKQIDEHTARLAPLFTGKRFGSLYVGGGTVTCLSEQELESLFGTLLARFEIAPDAGRAVEFNPESTTLAKLRIFKAQGFERLSCGIQTFAPEILAQQGRQSASDEAVRDLLGYAVEHFASTNVDLLMGLPGQTIEGVLSDIERAASFGVKEIHAYFYQDVGTGAEELHPLARDLRDEPAGPARGIRHQRGRLRGDGLPPHLSAGALAL